MKTLTLVGDFETTVFYGQSKTEVWASALVKMYTEDVKLFTSIDETWDYMVSLNRDMIIYYHNLKFDGCFWLNFLLTNKKFFQAAQYDENGGVYFNENNEMYNHSLKYRISDMGQWYSITIKENNHIIELRDSYKLLPFSVEKIGKSFNTKHKKLDIEYEGERHAGGCLTENEKMYISNDVLVVKEGLEQLFDEGHTGLTIGSCCLKYFKHLITKDDYNSFFPDLYSYTLPEFSGASNADEYIRRSYHGGWCYVARGKEKKIFKDGITLDVNSLYPSMMSSESGNFYPIGEPYYLPISQEPKIDKDLYYYYIRIKTHFKLKKGYLPFIQIKRNFLYRQNECLETSFIYDKNGNEYRYYEDEHGEIHDTRAILTLSQTDYELLKEHYEIIDCEYLDLIYFHAMKGIFDGYINHFKAIKTTSTGAKRELAKLFLNNLYGKMAASTESDFKEVFMDNGVLKFRSVAANDKKPGYIAVGAAITSYARAFTVRAAQQNYYGVDKRGFIYADTDSIHCDLSPEELKGVIIHDTNFNSWKIETQWTRGFFTRQKTYIEERKEGKEIVYDIKCAGMGCRCKELLALNFEGVKRGKNDEENKFLSVSRDIDCFVEGLKIPGKLAAKRIVGGTVLCNTLFEIR